MTFTFIILTLITHKIKDNKLINNEYNVIRIKIFFVKPQSIVTKVPIFTSIFYKLLFLI